MGSTGYQVPTGEFADPLVSERAVDQARPLRVIYIGAGISGINAAIRLPKLVSKLELVVYDKNADVGGSKCSSRNPSSNY